MKELVILMVLGPVATALALLILLRARPQSTLGEAAAALAAARPTRALLQATRPSAGKAAEAGRLVGRSLVEPGSADVAKDWRSSNESSNGRPETA